jgi:glycosyltransferase involved in cell wall biosynthesis
MSLTTPSVQKKDSSSVGSQEDTSRPFVSVIVPVYNESEVLAANVQKISTYLSANFARHELIVVDDGSEDDSPEVIRQLIQRIPNLHPVCYRPNRGKGYAVRAGARFASGEWVAIVDADLEVPIEMLPDFFEVQKRTGAMIVIGSKRHGKSQVVYPKDRMLLSGGYNRLVRVLFKLHLTDTQLGFKLFHSSVLQDIVDPMLVKRYAFDLELLVAESMRGVKIVEAPVSLEFSRPGSGRLSLSTSTSVMLETAGIWYRRYITGYYSQRIRPAKTGTEMYQGSPTSVVP